MRESEFQTRLIKKLRLMFPGCIILKNDANYLQGIPDLSIFCENWYAFLEVKAGEDYVPEVNQPYYVRVLNEMSYAAFIYPENEEAILDGLSRSFEDRGRTRLSEPQ